MMSLPIQRLHRRSADRAAYTLAEMLVVMTIILMLVAITLPAIKNVMQDGNVREASRQLNAYFAMAKSRALQTGRPCGVMLICDLPLGLQDPPSATPNIPLWPTRQVTKMYLAEVPAPYSGGTVGAKGRIMSTGNPNAPFGEFVPLTSSGSGGFIVDPSEQAILGPNAAPGIGLLLDGETFIVRFDYKGPWFVCQRSGNTLAYLNKNTTGYNTPVPPGYVQPNIIPGYTYQIIRMPRRIGNPLELPGGTCIDLAYSGIGPTNLPSNTIRYGMFPTDPLSPQPAPPGLFPGSPPLPQTLQAISVMFTPGGGIDSVYLNNWFFTPPTTVHFLIGRTDKMNPPLGVSTSHPTALNMYDPAVSNLADPQALWVSVARSTGNVSTSDNMPPTVSGATALTMNILGGGTTQQVIPNIDAGQITYLSFCRQLATNREQTKAQ